MGDMRAGLSSLLRSERFCKWAIVVCAALWGSSFVVMKGVTDVFPVNWVLAIRFLPTGIAFMLIFRRRVKAHLDRASVGIGVAYGLLNWGAYLVQTIGLTMTTPGKNAFLTATYCVMVPFCAWLMGAGRPAAHHVLGVALALVGLGFVALDNGLPLNAGDMLTLAGAALYAVSIALLSVKGGGVDAMAVSAWEFLVMGVLFSASAVLLEGPLDVALLTSGNIARFAFLLLLVTAFALTLFNHALTVVEPAQSALLSALESPFGVLTSVLMGLEGVTARLLAGFALIAAGIVSSEAGGTIFSRMHRG